MALTGMWDVAHPVAAGSFRLKARPSATVTSATSGAHRLELGAGRDGVVYVPKKIAPDRPLPLAVMLHGAGQSASRMSFTFALAEECGVAILAPDSRARTWDLVLGSFGNDVRFIDAALEQTFGTIAIDRKRVAIGGFSDGASYALSLGSVNGDLFTHVIAFSPGFLASEPAGARPYLFISHGTDDRILPIHLTSRRLVPELRDAGFIVRFREFDGGHGVPEDVAREAFQWFVDQ
jgi:phospholipase/carboxylesterase